MRRAATNDTAAASSLRWYRSVSAPRLVAAATLVVVAVATGGVWWALAAIALVPIIVGTCASCQVTVASSDARPVPGDHDVAMVDAHEPS